MSIYYQTLKDLLFRPFLFSLLLTFVLTFFLIPVAIKFGLIDDANIRKHPAHTHKGIIPRAGGLAILIGLIMGILFFIPITKQVLGIMLGAAILITVGLIDDKYDISPYTRLITNIIAALVVVGSGIGIPFITNPLGGIIPLDTWIISFNFWGQHDILVWADIFAVIWIVWCMNMVNWSKGVDGQMPGFVGISALTIGLLSLRFINIGGYEQLIPATLAFITAGIFFGFLPWNFYPQKIMPGYGGGSLAGYLLAVLSILSGAKVGTAFIVMGIPMIDAFYTIIRRLSTKKSPFLGDRGHLHHRLLNIGWGRRRIALFYWIISVILGIIALNITSKEKLFVVLLLAVLLGGFLLWLTFFSTFSKLSDRDNG